MTRVVLLVAIVGCGAPSAPHAVPPQSALQPLSKVFARIETGFVEFLTGKEASGTWKPWPSMADATEDLAELKEEMKADEPARFMTYAMDFDVCFINERSKTPIAGWIKALVMFDGEEATLGSIQFDEGGTLWNGAGDVEAYGRLQPELAAAGSAFIEAVRSGNRAVLAIVDARRLSRRLPVEVREEFKQEAWQAPGIRASIQTVLDKVARLEYTKVLMRLDRCFTTTAGKHGEILGVAGLHFDLDRSSGQVSVTPYDYKSFKKRGK